MQFLSSQFLIKSAAESLPGLRQASGASALTDGQCKLAAFFLLLIM
jgi:hypothetical protein